MHELFHHNDPHRDLSHIHSVMCDLVTPKKLSSILSDALKLQNNQTEKKDYLQYLGEKRNYIKRLALQANKPKLIPQEVNIHLHDLNKMDFISKADAKQLITEYKDFYSTHENEINQQYLAYRNQPTLQDECIDVGKTILTAFSHAIMLAVIEKSLVKAGISKKRSQQITTALQLILLALTSETPGFFLAAGLLLYAFNRLEASQSSRLAMQALTFLAIAAVHGYANSMPLLKGITYASGSAVSGFAARKISQRLFPAQENNETPEQNTALINPQNQMKNY